jgi:hypothetical protein
MNEIESIEAAVCLAIDLLLQFVDQEVIEAVVREHAALSQAVAVRQLFWLHGIELSSDLTL